MKFLRRISFTLFALMAFVVSGFAGSATWLCSPVNGDWNNPFNWTPTTVPNGPFDIATFSLSNTTSISLSADTLVYAIGFDPAATNPFTITVGSNLTLNIDGPGVSNFS